MGGFRFFFYLILFFLTHVIVVHDCASGVTHYVSHTGSNVTPFTSWATAANQVSSAARWCLPEDTILVGIGTFVESDTVGLPNGGTLIGVDGDSSEIVMPPDLGRLIFCDGGRLLVKRLQLRTTGGNHYDCAIYYGGFQSSDSLTIESCVIYGFDCAMSSFARTCQVSECNFIECGIDGGPVCWLNWGSGNSKFEGNHFVSSNKRPGHHQTYIRFDINWNADSSIVRNNVFRGALVAVDNVGSQGRLLIENNKFLNNVDIDDRPEPYVRSNGPYTRITNNLFECENPAYAFGQQVFLGVYKEAYVENNIFIGAMPGVGYYVEPTGELPALITIQNNDFYLNSHRPNIVVSDLHQATDSFFCENVFESAADLITLIQNNLCSSPMFVDTIDYLLQQNSPAIDAGVINIHDPDGTRSDIGYHGGPGGNSYSYQDLPPGRPKQLAGEEASGKVQLTFWKSAEADLSYYAIIRSGNASIPLDSQHVVGYSFDGPASSYLDTSRVVFIDSLISVRSDLYYTVVAVDKAQLVSEPADPLYLNFTSVSNDFDDPLPRDFELFQNYPNPFNATTAIVYSLPNIGAQPALVTLAIYNTLGQEVRTLVRQNQYPGRQVAYWDGRDNAGAGVASGVYFYKLRVSGVDLITSRKMLLLK